MTIKSFESDLEETQEWLDSVDGLVAAEGIDPAGHVLNRAFERARSLGVQVPTPLVTDYVNTIPPSEEPPYPGDEAVEPRIRHYIRWNAAVMVARANRRFDGIGGHLATYASAATLYEVGFNHFFAGRPSAAAVTRCSSRATPRQGSTPGVPRGSPRRVALDGFRREVGGGLPSYPHPRRCHFWEFPTVSMGLGLINAAYQARFNRYLSDRGIVDTSELDACGASPATVRWTNPKASAGVALAGRERLDNLIFVVNCNLQRLDGPVRGNGKVIQELEGLFRGAGWNVIKVVWGREWDELLAADTDGVLVDKMNATVDGEFQKYRVESGAYIREHFFGPDPRSAQWSSTSGDEDLRGCAAVATTPARSTPPTRPRSITRRADGDPGQDREGLGTRARLRGPQRDPPDEEDDRGRAEDVPGSPRTPDRRRGPRPTSCLPTSTPASTRRVRVPDGAPAGARRQSAGAELSGDTRRHCRTDPYPELFRGTATRSQRPPRRRSPGCCATCCATRSRSAGRPDHPRRSSHLRHRRPVPRQKIYAPGGQRYEPVDADLLLSYQEATDGQILEEGITEAGSMASFTAAATAYATWGEPMIPFFVFYSMFGFHRFGGPHLGAGRHARPRVPARGDGRPHDTARRRAPTLRRAQPAVARPPQLPRLRPGLRLRSGRDHPRRHRRMYGADPEDFSTTSRSTTRPSRCPRCPPVSRRELFAGLYRCRPAARSETTESGSWPAALRCRPPWKLSLLADDHDVAADVWSATSYQHCATMRSPSSAGTASIRTTLAPSPTCSAFWAPTADQWWP